MKTNERKKLADELLQGVETNLAQDKRIKSFKCSRDIDHTRNKIKINIQIKE